MADWDAWEDYKRQRQEMLARHESEQYEMFHRQRAESEKLTEEYMNARASRNQASAPSM